MNYFLPSSRMFRTNSHNPNKIVFNNPHTYSFVCSVKEIDYWKQLSKFQFIIIFIKQHYKILGADFSAPFLCAYKNFYTLNTKKSNRKENKLRRNQIENKINLLLLTMFCVIMIIVSRNSVKYTVSIPNCIFGIEFSLKIRL